MIWQTEDTSETVVNVPTYSVNTIKLPISIDRLAENSLKQFFKDYSGGKVFRICRKYYLALFA